MKTENLSPLALAFLGDAVHTAFVRIWVLEHEKTKMENYHERAKKFCNAAAQAQFLEKIMDSLSDDEKEIVRKTRNAKPKHTAKNCDEKTYKAATCFEALVGYLYLTNTQKLEEILKKSVE